MALPLLLDCCDWCGQDLPPHVSGRPRLYCGGPCRSAAHHERKSQVPPDLAAVRREIAEEVLKEMSASLLTLLHIPLPDILDP